MLYNSGNAGFGQVVFGRRSSARLTPCSARGSSKPFALSQATTGLQNDFPSVLIPIFMCFGGFYNNTMVVAGLPDYLVFSFVSLPVSIGYCSMGRFNYRTRVQTHTEQG